MAPECVSPDSSEAAGEPPDVRRAAASATNRAAMPGAPSTWSIRRLLRRDDSRQPLINPELHGFVAGWTAAFTNTTLLFPMNKLIFRQMAGGYGAVLAGHQLKDEGFYYLYRGILPPLIQKMVSVSIMFGSFGHYQHWCESRFSWAPAGAHLVLAAFLTGTTEAVLTPLERVQMLLQDRQFHGSYKNTRDALVKLRVHGLPEYYRGLTCVLFRNGPSNILFFGLRDKIKMLLPPPRATNQTQQSPGSSSSSPSTTPTNYTQTATQHNMVQHFLSGAILGMVISTLFYPLSVVRTRMQTRPPGTKFLSIWAAFKQVYCERDRKFSKLFRGCLINVLRQFVSWGIINSAYERTIGALKNL